MLGDLTLGKAYVGVRVVQGVQVLAPHGSVPVVLVACYPDLLPGVDAHDLLVVVREAHLAVGPGHWLPRGGKRQYLIAVATPPAPQIQYAPFTWTKAFVKETARPVFTEHLVGTKMCCKL